jgi:hypothetical protein
MKSSERSGWFHRAWTAICRGLLGKSGHEYRKQFTGSDEYWDEVIAAQRGWPEKQRPTHDAAPVKESFSRLDPASVAKAPTSTGHYLWARQL